MALPGCTKEGVLYIIDCQTCRLKGVKRQYIGQSSRSGYQRGREHDKVIGEGVETHPLTIHFEEEHKGEKQDILFRIINKYQTALSRQVAESVLIEEVTTKQMNVLI